MSFYSIEVSVRLTAVTTREFENEAEADAFADGLRPTDYDPYDFDVLSVDDMDVNDVWSMGPTAT